MSHLKYLLNNVPSPELAPWVEEQFDLLEKGLDYTDNRRWYEVGDTEGDNFFQEQEADGCCGSITREVVHPTNGKTYVFGLNHGH